MRLEYSASHGTIFALRPNEQADSRAMNHVYNPETVWTHSQEEQARIQVVGAGAGAYPWDGAATFKIHHAIAFKDQFITGRPPLGEILYPPLRRPCQLDGQDHRSA